MTPDQFQLVRDLFEQVLTSEPADLRAWLDEHAGSDRDVRAEVAALLNYHSQAGSFLAEPVAGRVPELLEEDTALPPGTTIGAYTIEREIGRGGMGRVYLAKDVRLGRTVALKALPAHLTHSPSSRERLRREARAAAALTHPGICTVFALEEFNGDLFIVTEYVEGHTLREEIAQRKMPSAQQVRTTARELAEALASAHAKGITHRDLKPENIMRAANGHVKILDFGLARFDEPHEGTGELLVTQPGTLLGTPAYMAPEQLNGEPADARADVFACGVVIYEYACGAHPFAAATPIGVAARVLQGDVTPLDERCPSLTPALVGVIERCLMKAPGDRFRSAGELAAALSREEPAQQRTAVTAWWRRHQVAVVGLYLVASIVGWLVKEWQPGVAGTIFLLIGIASTAGGVLRGHLMFTERMNNAGFDRERRRLRPITLGVDLLIALALAADGVMANAARPLASVLTIALAVGIALVSVIVEPATTAAAFRRQSG